VARFRTVVAPCLCEIVSIDGVHCIVLSNNPVLVSQIKRCTQLEPILHIFSVFWRHLAVEFSSSPASIEE
jgi:hypothetical protein